jgi:hypothetical protein
MRRLYFDPPCGSISSAGALALCVVNKILLFRLNTMMRSSHAYWRRNNHNLR